MRTLDDNDMGPFAVGFIVAYQGDAIREDAGEIPRSQIRTRQLCGVVDTGATRLVLPESLVAELGLMPRRRGNGQMRQPADKHTEDGEVCP